MISQQSSRSGDDQLLDQAIAEFLRAEAAGQAGDRQQWLDRFPACAADLAEFFDDRERVDLMIVPLRLDSPPGSASNQLTEDVASPYVSRIAATLNLSPEPPSLLTARYRPIRYHAGGGMGEIWLAEDERIGRHVALKKLRSGRIDEQGRFFVEAQITGQLEHPSVVPLHDLGLDDEGQPYYIMKFIKGRRLREAIAEFHAEYADTDWSDNLDFRRLLESFVSICNVVAYAHSKGVLHRDIKPDNVMLGSYGETLVVDWGLAKVIGQPDEMRGSCVHLSGGGSTETQDGAIVGSPYYMPPEGAEGHPEAVDESSDVYLLGATLYEILTARPPRQGSSSWELIDLARHSSPIHPRKLNARIPRSLEAICLKAMAFHKEDRYATPMDLADDVERYMAGAPTVAYKEPLVARAWRWIRRHRRGIVRGLAVAGIMLLSFLTIWAFRRAHTLAAREQAREQLTEFNRLADEAQFFAANTDAVAERVPYYDARRAKAAGQAALAIAAPWGQKAERLPLEDQRDDLLHTQYSLLLLLAQTELLGERDNADPRAALARLDQVNSLQQPSRGYYRLRGRSHLLLGESAAAAHDEQRAVHSDTPTTAQDHFLQGELLRLEDAGIGASAINCSSTPRRKHLEMALAEYQHSLQLDPRHYWARFQLGRCLIALGRGPEAAEVFSACIAIRPTSPWAYSARGLANALSGRPHEAFADLNRAVALDPNFQPARLNRGFVAYWLLHDARAALADFDAVLAAPAEKRLVEAAYYRGQVFLSDGQDNRAFADFSTVINEQPNFRPAYWLRSKTQFRLGNFVSGLADIEEFLELESHQVKPATTADSRLALGKALRNMGQQLNGEARRQVLQRAADDLQSAIDAGPPTAEMWQHFGAVQELSGKHSDAIEAYSHGVEISPDDVQLRNMRGWAHVNQTKYKPAQADFAEVIRLDPKNAEAHTGMGFVLAELSRDEDAHYEVSAALLAGSDNHLTLHNIACIFGRLSASQTEKKTEFENLALAALERAVLTSRQNPIGPDADELALIRNERSFPTSLQSRPEFKRLLSDERASPR